MMSHSRRPGTFLVWRSVPGTLGGAVSFDVAQAGIDVAIVTTYIGPRQLRPRFVCGILGSIVDLTKADPASRRGRILSARDLC